TVTGDSVTVAEPERAGSCTLVAVTVTVCCEEIGEGGVYNPVLLTLPSAGLRDHVTELFVAFCTVGVNCCVCDADSVTLAGDKLTVTGSCHVTVRLTFVTSAQLS